MTQPPMTGFSTTVFQNEYLPVGGTDVHAIVRASCTGVTDAGPTGDGAEVLIVDTSGSMRGSGIVAARQAAQAALREITDGTYFAVVAGTHLARQLFPASGPMVRMDPNQRAAAIAATEGLQADGGTAMGTWLREAKRVFETVPGVARRHAILLTDGANEHESPQDLTAAISSVTGAYQADCRGMGDRWVVDEVRRIASALLGTVDLIPRPEQMAQEFAGLMRDSMSRGVADVQLRVWTPQGSQVVFVKQVSPHLEDLTARGVPAGPLTTGYPTGAWAQEERDYHVAIRLAPETVGQERLAARVQLAVAGEVVGQGLVKAKWTADENLSARLSPEVAQYTGRAELAAAIQDGLAAKAAGQLDEATSRLGRAVQLANQAGDAEMTARLLKVVEVENAETGTVRLRRDVEKLDEISLDTSSTKTARVRPTERG